MMDSHCTLSLSSLDCDDFVSTVITVYTAIAVSIIIVVMMNMNLNHEEHKFIIRRLERIHLMSRTNSLDVQYVDLHYL